MTNMFVKKELRKKPLTERERTQENVRKEDFLIRQIDEFKDKAKQLQLLLDSKESRVQQLQGIVEEREKKAQGLQEILAKKQQEADQINRDLEGYANQIARELGSRLTALKDDYQQQRQAQDAKLAEAVEQLSALMREYETKQAVTTEAYGTRLITSVEEYETKMSAGMQEYGDKLSAGMQEYGDKLSTGMQECGGELSKSIQECKDRLSGSIQEYETKLAASMQDYGTRLATSAEAYEANLAASAQEYGKKLEDLLSGLEEMKHELSEKIHTENVKSYRNVQTLIEELKSQISQGQNQQDMGKSLKGYLRAAIILGVVNLAVLIVFFLEQLGIF